MDAEIDIKLEDIKIDTEQHNNCQKLIDNLNETKQRFLLESYNHKIHEKFYNRWNLQLGYPSTLLIVIATFLGGLQARGAATLDPFNIAILIMNGISTIISVSIIFWKLGDKKNAHANASGDYSNMAKKLHIFLLKSNLTMDDLLDQEINILDQELVIDKYKPNFGAFGCIKPKKSLE